MQPAMQPAGQAAGHYWNLLLAGAPGAGKSTLCKLLLGHEGTVRKTQSPEYHARDCIDIPGEYLSHPHLRRSFLAIAHDARALLYLQAADVPGIDIPAGLLRTVPGLELVGVITKIDLPSADMERAAFFLQRYGVAGPYHSISVFQQESVERLKAWLVSRGLLGAKGHSVNTP